MNIMNRHQPRTATLYRMVMQEHLCPYGLKAKDLLQCEGFKVEDRWLTSREEIDASNGHLRKLPLAKCCEA